MSEPVKKLQWGYTGMIPFSETAEKLGLHAYVRVENYQFMKKRADNLEAENTRLKAEVGELCEAIKLASEVGIKIANEVTRLKAEVERLRKAGDAMLPFFIYPPYEKGSHKAVLNWNAAKEGKPSV